MAMKHVRSMPSLLRRISSSAVLRGGAGTPLEAGKPPSEPALFACDGWFGRRAAGRTNSTTVSDLESCVTCLRWDHVRRRVCTLQLPEEDELVWDDGTANPEPCLDVWTTQFTPGESLAMLSGALGLLGGVYGLVWLWNTPSLCPYTPKQYPYNNLEKEFGGSTNPHWSKHINR